MSVNTSSRLAIGNEGAQERAEEERAKIRRPEEWAMLLAQSVNAQIPPNWRLLAELPGAWRADDKPLTPERPVAGNTALVAGTAAATASGDAEQLGSGGNGARMSMTIDGGDLGELSLIVDRTKEGVRVVIGVEDARALSAMDPERGALERALAATGLSIESVKVVARASIGTLLAPTWRSRAPAGAERGEGNEVAGREPRRAQRRIRLIG